MNKPITQKHFMSCGLACVAYIVGKNYDELASLQPKKKLDSIDFYCPGLVMLLKQHGYNFKWRKLSKKEKYPVVKNGDIVFIARSPEIPYGHFMVGWILGQIWPKQKIYKKQNLVLGKIFQVSQVTSSIPFKN